MPASPTRTALAVLLIVVGIAAAATLMTVRRQPAPTPTVGQTTAEATAPETSETLSTVPTAEEPQRPTFGPERTTVDPVPYFPPPTVNLSGGTLGNQVVPGTEAIGDISQLYWHDSSAALFMTVNEPTGLRSVWRLDQNGRLDRVFADDANGGEIRIIGDGTGVMYVMLNNPDRVYRTADAFKTWRLVLSGKGIFWDMASDARGNVYATLHSYNEPILYRSPDKGFSWEPWIDFAKVMPEEAVPYADGDTRNRLRHLHSVIYNEKTDSLLVGTGDVARWTLLSNDDGKTWERIWHEGFTAHVAVGGGSRYLLCPDKLRGPGIALYDAWAGTVTETFNPGDHGYAGYCYSLLNAEGIYYAAFHTEANEVEEIVPKSGIVASPDGVRWYRFIEWDPLGNHARTNIWMASAPARIYASVNGRLHAFKPLEKSWFQEKEPLP